ncbi:MAG: serine/threonine-protein kinase, partial [Gemmataceae bacterium]
MDTLVQSGPQLDLDYRIDAFEEARRLNPKTDLSWFLPPREHPGYLTALGELIRVEMDRDWADGKPRSLREYCRRYPEVAGNPEVLRNVAFEEYRLRRQTGESIRPQEYAAEFQVDIAAWPLLPPRPGELEAAGVAEAARSSWADSVESAAGHDQVLREFERAEPDSAKRWANAVHGIPPAGSEFLGFRLLEELGRGAFGRVFLAQQGDLADRPVALKVATDIFQESQTLAQLQHANIVPIYSFHKAGALQAVCMPYFGSTTLGHVLQHIQGQAGLPTSGRDLISTVNGRRSITRDSQLPSNRSAGSAPAPLTPIEEPAAPAAAAIFAPASETWKRLEALSFTDAVLWLAARVTDGLAHAHEHGVLHRDLKPANILLTNDGQPMLLDFNLSAPGGVRANAAAARVGGTLPYMAPEHMQAFRGGQVQPDERSDIYSLGVILYTLLAGRNPFPAYKGRMRDIVDLMFQDRCRNAPRLRPLNPSVSPALEAIVLRCLDPDPAKRYQTARHLHEDLELQLAHRPLKHTPEPSRLERLAKWRKRHPRLTSAGSVAALAAALLIGVVAAAAAGREEYRTLHAREQLAAHQSEFGSIQVQLDRRDPSKETLDDGIERSKGELARYGISPNDPAPSWDQATEVRYLSTAERIRLADDVGELFFLMAKAAA